MNFGWAVPLFLASTALAQTAGQEPAVIEGTVLNSVTKGPLRKVELTLANGQMSQEMAAMVQRFNPGASAQMPSVATRSMAATTDANGKFRFENVSPGEWWLTAKKVGFADGRFPKGGDGSVRLTPGQELKAVEIRLVPHATLSGRVLDEDGEPLPSTMVSALTYTYVHGRRRTAPVDFAQTNNKGEFSLTKVPPGRYFLSADPIRVGFGVKPPPPPADGSPETAYVGTYLPGVLEAEQAQRIEVAAGADLSGFDIQMMKAKVVRVSGRLMDANGEPVKNAQLMVMAGGRVGSMSMSMISDPQGKFELVNLQPGTYTVMAMQMQGSSPKISMQSLVVPEKSVENVVLGARPDVAIQGRVTLAEDAKIALRDFPVSLTPAEGTAVMPAFGKADEGGRFILEQVAAARYDLDLPLSPEGTYVKSVLFNDRDALGQILDCSALPSASLQIMLGTDGGQVEARVSREDKPAANATVVLLPADPGHRFPLTTKHSTTDGAGRAMFKDVRPGDYLAFAWAGIEEGVWFDPEFIKGVQSQAVSVQVGPKSSQQIQVKLLPASR